ncbi:hypothetical protein C3420_11345 [Acinetobacter sp. ACNIH3]|uniref:hypothetical protein n=1 Tax=unclassified Acinetobacter TaxID=196816 RepID=UPI000CDD5BCA|nr:MULTISPECIES: hypothetical protein [unclassified Acinetobacter]POU21716.1 hypothetical protein C3420_11345 [Acinetobacter sp. ACNIH3]POV74338.1 hypothetical protein C3421_15160 [Acinetobacter sp. ACNIH4]
MSKEKPKMGFGEELEEIQANPEATLEDVTDQQVEYTRNLMYKIILTPHTGEVKKRTRKDHGRLASVPLYYEEEKVLKEAAGFVGESLNDFIRDVVLKEARRVLGAEKFNATMNNPLNQTKVRLSDEEHLKLSEQRKAEREKNKPSKAQIYSV